MQIQVVMHLESTVYTNTGINPFESKASTSTGSNALGIYSICKYRY